MAALTTNDERHSWLTSEFLETILKSSEANQNVKVIDFGQQDAVEKGKNFFSCLMRVVVNYNDGNGSKTKQTAFIIKTTLESEVMNGIMRKVKFFDKEIVFYRDIVPKFKKYTDIIDKNFNFSARFFAASDNPTYIVLEDLSEKNYRTMDSVIGLDFNATAMVLRKLAKRHAMTSMIYEESPELFEPYKVAIFSSENPELLTAVVSGVRDCQQMCLNWPGYEHFYEKLQYWLDHAIEIADIVYNKDDSTFNTLTHGDIWINNIMYQFDENNTPVDVNLIDYQFAIYGSPAMDLTYLFYTSTMNTVFEEDWDRLLQIYHAELVKSLELIKYPKRIPSLVELQIQMLKKSLCSAIISLSIVPPRHMDRSKEDVGHDTLMSNEDHVLQARCALYQKPIVYERLQYLLNFYDRKGFFNALP